jgi:hypothetical protein
MSYLAYRLFAIDTSSYRVIHNGGNYVIGLHAQSFHSGITTTNTTVKYNRTTSFPSYLPSGSKCFIFIRSLILNFLNNNTLISINSTCGINSSQFMAVLSVDPGVFNGTVAYTCIFWNTNLLVYRNFVLSYKTWICLPGVLTNEISINNN